MLDKISANVSSQLTQQSELGVEIVPQDSVPDRGPVRRGVWVQIPQVTAVFADIKGSTVLNTKVGAATTYVYFNIADDPLRGDTLIANVFDRTGLLDVRRVRWQWARSSSRTRTFTDIGSATSSSYTVGSCDG